MGGDQGQLTPDGKWKEPPCFPPAHTHGCFQVFLLPTLFKTAVNPCYFQFSFWGGVGHTHSIWKFQGQELNPYHSSDPSHSSDHIGSLNH